MAFAMQFPNDKRGRGSLSFQNDNEKPDRAQANLISKSRYVLRNNPPASNSPFPQYALDVMSGLMTLTEAYDATQKDMAARQEANPIHEHQPL